MPRKRAPKKKGLTKGRGQNKKGLTPANRKKLAAKKRKR